MRGNKKCGTEEQMPVLPFRVLTVSNPYQLSLAAIATGFALFAADFAAASGLGHASSPFTVECQTVLSGPVVSFSNCKEEQRIVPKAIRLAFASLGIEEIDGLRELYQKDHCIRPFHRSIYRV